MHDWAHLVQVLLSVSLGPRRTTDAATKLTRQCLSHEGVWLFLSVFHLIFDELDYVVDTCSLIADEALLLFIGVVLVKHKYLGYVFFALFTGLSDAALPCALAQSEALVKAVLFWPIFPLGFVFGPRYAIVQLLLQWDEVVFVFGDTLIHTLERIIGAESFVLIARVVVFGPVDRPALLQLPKRWAHTGDPLYLLS